jgi:hypothetical protein
MVMKRLNTWERKILRWIYGPVVEQGMWRIRTNQELRELYKDLDIAADIKSNRLEQTQRLVRMDYIRVVKKVFESELEGRRRRRGRSRLRWLEDAEEDLRELKVKIWRHKVVDIEDWASINKNYSSIPPVRLRGVHKNNRSVLVTYGRRITGSCRTQS